MIKPNNELAKLMAAAINLVQARDASVSEIVRIGDARFRLMTEYREDAGWLVVLVDASNAGVCDQALKRYGLTDREVEVARLLADRRSNREIAELLNVQLSTAGRHTENVLRKLGLSSRRDVRARVTMHSMD
jgi:DNA-binding NarL/FixJ family response regulator